eukprot:s1809_g12.t3
MRTALQEALEVECKRGETWHLYQVEKGVGIEQIYPSLGASIKEPDRPLELKLQTIWGRVIGGTIHTSQELWVTASGRVLRCDNRKSGIRRKYGPIPSWILDGGFETMLQEHWTFLVSESEGIARLWGLDEVRVDWFLGCPDLGPRICEVTWMGTGDRIPPQLQLPVAQAFFAGHRRRAKAKETIPKDATAEWWQFAANFVTLISKVYDTFCLLSTQAIKGCAGAGKLATPQRFWRVADFEPNFHGAQIIWPRQRWWGKL